MTYDPTTNIYISENRIWWIVGYVGKSQYNGTYFRLGKRIYKTFIEENSNILGVEEYDSQTFFGINASRCGRILRDTLGNIYKSILKSCEVVKINSKIRTILINPVWHNHIWDKL